MNQNNSRNNDAIIIDLKELLWKLLGQWKAIVVFSLIVMLAFSGFQYLRSGQAAEEETVIKTPDEMLAGLSEKDRIQLSEVLREKEAKDRMSFYMDDSLMMKLDPYSVNTLTMNWAVVCDESLRDTIVSSYAGEVYSNSFLEAINTAWGNEYDIGQVEELCSVEFSTSTDEDDEVKGNNLELKVYVPDGKAADAAADAIGQSMDELKARLLSEVGEHKIVLLSADSKVVADNELSDRQYTVYNRLYSMVTQVNNLKDKLSPEQKAVFEKIAAYDEEAEATESTAAAPEKKASFSKRDLVLGLALGLILYCALFILYFVFTGKVRSARVISESLGVRTLGEWYPGKAKGAVNALLNDPFVSKKHHSGHMDLSAEVGRISESILNSLDGERRLAMISGTETAEGTSEFIGELKGRLEASGIVVSCAETNIGKGIFVSENLLKSNDAVVLIIDKNRMNTKDVKDVCSKCVYCSRPFIGAAYVG